MSSIRILNSFLLTDDKHTWQIKIWMFSCFEKNNLDVFQVLMHSDRRAQLRCLKKCLLILICYGLRWWASTYINKNCVVGSFFCIMADNYRRAIEYIWTVRTVRFVFGGIEGKWYLAHLPVLQNFMHWYNPWIRFKGSHICAKVKNYWIRNKFTFWWGVCRIRMEFTEKRQNVTANIRMKFIQMKRTVLHIVCEFMWFLSMLRIKYGVVQVTKNQTIAPNLNMWFKSI